MHVCIYREDFIAEENIGAYCWVVVSIQHSYNPNVAIKARPEMPFVHHMDVRL